MLVQACVDDAVKLGLPAYLESTPAAHKLYESCGFKDVEEHVVDMTKWGGQEKHVTFAMLRDVQSLN